MTRDDDQHGSPEQTPEELPEELDEALAFAYGEDGRAGIPTSPGRIGELTGSEPRVSLRDESAGAAPMLKPLGPGETREAGKYVVHGELGRGGVGAVHRGHDQDLGRDVAMKFLHARYKDEPAILNRFVEEAQIGGQLQHPGIVPVYDLGVVDGRPFFAMKLVKGQTLAKKLAERASPADDRRECLAIYEDVCQTVAYAHARGVVHRDLKPANIMIGSFGEVQVVDWGMGKVLASGGVADEALAADRRADRSVIETVRSGGRGTQSIVGSVMGTPAYMPPEQARGDVEAMDERSDVFALGAILCEILTGQPPYVGEKQDLIERASMGRLDEAHARLAACGAEPAMVELTTRCLMTAPAARPRSAEVVARAVHEHLVAVESRVHEARVEAAEARVRAAASRRAQVLGLGLTVVIAAGLAVSVWSWRAAETAAENEGLARAEAEASAAEAEENARRAVEQTGVAERELARAVEIKGLITGMLQSVTPEKARGADITLLRGILDTASQRLAEGAIDDEQVAAELHALVGGVYHSLGLYPEAELHLPVALETRSRLLGEEDPYTLQSMDKLANLYADEGRYAEAERLVRRRLEIERRVQGEEHPNTLAALANLAILEQHQGRPAEAERLSRETLDIQRRVLGVEHPSTLMSMSNLALLCRELGRYAEAGRLQHEVLENRRRVLGEAHPDTLASMESMANLEQAQGRYAEAELLFVDSLEIHERVLGEEHPATLDAKTNLANCYRARGRLAEAEPLLLRTLEARRRVQGEEHASTLAAMGSLASLFKDQGRHAEAEALSLRSLEIRKRVFGEEHPGTLKAMGNLANLYSAQGRPAEAETLQLQVLEIRRRVLGVEHPDTLVSTGNLASHYARQGRHAEAEAIFLQVLGIERRVLGVEHPYTLSIMRNLAALYAQTGRPGEALALERQLLGPKVAAADAVDASFAVLNDAAWALLTIGDEGLRDPGRALGFATRACALAGDNWALLDTLALAQHATGDTAAALATQERAFALMPEGADPGLAVRLAEYGAAAEGR